MEINLEVVDAKDVPSIQTYGANFYKKRRENSAPNKFCEVSIVRRFRLKFYYSLISLLPSWIPSLTIWALLITNTLAEF